MQCNCLKYNYLIFRTPQIRESQLLIFIFNKQNMKKLKTIFMLVAVAIGLTFASCSDDNVSAGTETNTGNTNVAVSLSLSLGNSGTRALPEDYNYVGQWAGKDEINT